MTPGPSGELEQAIAITQRDHGQPIKGVRSDTGETIWLVESQSDPHCYYVLSVKVGHIHCPCPQSHQGHVCAHVAAVHMALQPPSQEQPHEDVPRSENRPAVFPGKMRSDAPCFSEEHQWKDENRRRERALLWTDDKPSSIWKA